MLHDIDARVAECAGLENGLTGGVLLPGRPTVGYPQLHDLDYYDALERLRRLRRCR